MASTDHLQRKKHMLQVVAWLRENYKVGKSGSTSKNAVYQHYSDMCSERGIEPSINATYFGKLVKRAFPGVQYNRKGPRGNSLQHYTHLKRINHDKLKQQRLVEEASRAVENCGVPEEEALYRLMREKYAEMFAPLAAGLDVARAPHHYAAAPLHPVAAAAALLAADGGGHPSSSSSYARPTRTGLLSPGDAALHGDPRFRAAATSSLHSGASDPDGATGSESPASGSPSLPPPSSSSSSSAAGALGSRFLSSSLSMSTGASPPAGSSYAHLAHPSAHHHHQAGKAATAGFPSSSAHYVVSSSPPSSPGSGHHHHPGGGGGGGGAYAPPGHGHGAFGPAAFAYPPTCPYCHHCLHCYYSGGGAPAAGPPAFSGGGGGHVNAYAPSHHPAGPSSAAAAAAAAAAHLVTAKEASVLAQWVRERPFLPPIGTHGGPSAPRSADSTNVVVDDDDDDDDGRGRRDETDETHSHRRESARAQGPGGRVAGQW